MPTFVGSLHDISDSTRDELFPLDEEVQFAFEDDPQLDHVPENELGIDGRLRLSPQKQMLDSPNSRGERFVGGRR